MKTIVIVSEDVSYPLDEGFKKTTASLAFSLAKLGLGVTVFARRADGLALATGQLPGNKALVGRSLARALRAIRPDAILYVPEAAATLMSLLRARALAAQAGGAPVAVLSLQRREYPRALSPILRLLAPRLLLVLSERSLAGARGAGLEAARVPLGVEPTVFRPAEPGEKASLRQKYGVPEGRVILHVGHVLPNRNLGLLARSFVPGSHLLVVSSTSTSSDPQVKRDLQGLPVVFLDKYIENIEEIYRLADCYVFPTFSDRGAIEIPLSVLEAMATNLPVVTTKFGGIPDIFPDKVAREQRGLFVAASEDQLIEKLQRAAELADAGTRHLVRDFSWARVAQVVIESLEAAIGQRSGQEAASRP